ncbi:MAG: hypothetical protein IKH30_09710 [Clostridia bacterium]|nr:hypothetical protein [Clostridia bacterium]
MTQAEKDVVLSLRQQHYSFSAIAQTTRLPLGTIKSFLSRVGEKKETLVAVAHITADQTRCRQCGVPLNQAQHGKILLAQLNREFRCGMRNRSRQGTKPQEYWRYFKVE